MAAWCHSWRKLSRWLTDFEQEIAEGTRLVRRAVEFGQDNAVALAASAHAVVHLARDFDGSIALLDRALALDPNLAAGWYVGGFVRIWRGEPDDAIERIAHGMRLSPLGPDMYRMQIGNAMAHLMAGRTEDAASWAETVAIHRCDHAFPISILAAVNARAGRSEEASSAMQQLRQFDPELRLSNLGQWLPFRRLQDLETFADALREAGLPD